MFEFIKRKNHKATESIAVRKLWNYTSSNRSKITELCKYTSWVEKELEKMREDLDEARIQIEHVETIVEERK